MIDLTELLETILKYSDLDSLLDYYGKYYLCREEFGKQIEISYREFEVLALVLPVHRAEE